MSREIFKINVEPGKFEILIPKKKNLFNSLFELTGMSFLFIIGVILSFIGIGGALSFFLAFLQTQDPALIFSFFSCLLLIPFAYTIVNNIKGVLSDFLKFGDEKITISSDGSIKIGRYVIDKTQVENLKLIEKRFDNKQIKNVVAQNVLGKGKLRIDYDHKTVAPRSLSFAKHINYIDAIKIIDVIKETGLLDSSIIKVIKPKIKRPTFSSPKSQPVKDQTANIKKAPPTKKLIKKPQSFNFSNPLKAIKKYYHKASDFFSDYFMSFNKWQFIKDKVSQGFSSLKKSIGVSGIGVVSFISFIGVIYLINGYVYRNYSYDTVLQWLQILEGIGAIFIFILGIMCFLGLVWAYYKAFQSSMISNLLNELNIKRNNPTEFVESILNMAIYVMKLDGTIQDEEKEYVRVSFNKMLGNGSGEKALSVINKKENEEVDIEYECEKLNKTMTKRNKRLLVLYLVFIAGKSENKIQKNEIEGLKDIVEYLELEDDDWNLIRSWVYKNKSAQMDILNNLNLSSNEIEDQFNRIYIKCKMDIGLSNSQYIKRSVQEHLLKINQAYHQIKEGQLDVTEELSEKLSWLGIERGIEQMQEMENKLLSVLKMMIKKSLHNPRLVEKYESSIQEAYVYLLKNLRNVVIESNKNTDDRVDELLEENEEGITRVDKLLLELKGINDLNDKTENEMKKALDELELWKEKIKLYDTDKYR